MTLGLIAGFTAFGPAEKTLGTNVRVVYLHGAWVWAALAAFLASGVAGFTGLALEFYPGRDRPPAQTSKGWLRATLWHRWSRALGRTGLLFWITYLPISMWAMQTNWNGLFLAEPRWRMAVVFAMGGLLLQIGVALVEDDRWSSAANLGYSVALFLTLASAENVMHPPAPILRSDSRQIQFFFFGLLLFTFVAAYQVMRIWLRFDHLGAEKLEG